MKISINFLRDRTSTFEDNDRLALSTAIIKNILAPGGAGGGGGTTWLESAPKPYALLFDDVTCIYHQEIWHLYKVNC